jgi:hypothetical protein
MVLLLMLVGRYPEVGLKCDAEECASDGQAYRGVPPGGGDPYGDVGRGGGSRGRYTGAGVTIEFGPSGLGVGASTTNRSPWQEPMNTAGRSHAASPAQCPATQDRESDE